MYDFCEKWSNPKELSEYLYLSGIGYADYKRAIFECAKINGWTVTREDLIPFERFPYVPPPKERNPTPSEKEIALENASMECGHEEK